MQKAGAQRVAAELGLVLVAPDTSPRGSGVPGDPDGAWDFGLGAGFYLNATQEPWSAHYRMHDYVVHELPALIEAHFPVSRRRGISGHSMGGHGALVCALRNPGATCRCRPLRRSAIRVIAPGARRRSLATWARTRRPGASGMPVRCSRVRPNACRSWSTRASATTSSPSSCRKRYAMRRTRPATRWSCVCNQATTTATTSSPVSSRITCATMPRFSTVDPRYLKPAPIRGRITP